MKNYSAYDPETVQLLRTVLDEAWNTLQPHYRDGGVCPGDKLPAVNVIRADCASETSLTRSGKSRQPDTAKSP